MKTYYSKENEITELVKKFRSKTLEEKRWTHEAHLTVAAWFIKNHSYHEAICYLRSGIIEYNASLGDKNTPTDGYHETITLFWVWVINQYYQAYNELPLLDLCNTFLESKYADKNLFSLFYTEEVLFSTEARAVWVNSDKRTMEFPF